MPCDRSRAASTAATSCSRRCLAACSARSAAEVTLRARGTPLRRLQGRMLASVFPSGGKHSEGYFAGQARPGGSPALRS